MDITLDQFAQDLARAGYAKDTQKRYVDVIALVSKRRPKSLAAWTGDDVREAVDWLASLGRSQAWLNQRYCALKFLFKRTLGKPELIAFLKLPKVYSPLPTVLSLDEVNALLRAIREPRYQAIAMVMYGAGLRIAEALALEVSDIDGARGVIIVRHGKGNKAREAKLSPVLYGWLRDYWSRTRPTSTYLFACPRRGIVPRAETVRGALAKAAKEAWLKKPVTPHVLRHSFATHLLDEGTDVLVVAKLLGHASLQSTARYARVTQKRRHHLSDQGRRNDHRLAPHVLATFRAARAPCRLPQDSLVRSLRLACSPDQGQRAPRRTQTPPSSSPVVARTLTRADRP